MHCGMYLTPTMVATMGSFNERSSQYLSTKMRRHLKRIISQYGSSIALNEKYFRVFRFFNTREPTQNGESGSSRALIIKHAQQPKEQQHHRLTKKQEAATDSSTGTVPFLLYFFLQSDEQEQCDMNKPVAIHNRGNAGFNVLGAKVLAAFCVLASLTLR